MPVRVTIVSVPPHATAGSQRVLCSSDSGSLFCPLCLRPIVFAGSFRRQYDARRPVLWRRALIERWRKDLFFPPFCFCLFVCKNTDTRLYLRTVYFQAPNCTCVEQTVSSKVYSIFYIYFFVVLWIATVFRVAFVCIVRVSRLFFTFSFFLSFFLQFSRWSNLKRKRFRDFLVFCFVLDFAFYLSLLLALGSVTEL